MRRAMAGLSSCSNSLSVNSAFCPAANRATAASPAETHVPNVPCTTVDVARWRQNHGSTAAFTPRAQYPKRL